MVSLYDKPDAEGEADGEQPDRVNDAALIVVEVVFDLSVSHGVTGGTEPRAEGDGEKRASRNAPVVQKTTAQTMDLRTIVARPECDRVIVACLAPVAEIAMTLTAAPRRHLSLPTHYRKTVLPAACISCSQPPSFTTNTANMSSREPMWYCHEVCSSQATLDAPLNAPPVPCGDEAFDGA